MEHFVKIVNDQKPFSIFTKHYILDLWQGFLLRRRLYIFVTNKSPNAWKKVSLVSVHKEANASEKVIIK